jgi:hypothetical protein
MTEASELEESLRKMEARVSTLERFQEDYAKSQRWMNNSHDAPFSGG